MQVFFALKRSFSVSGRFLVAPRRLAKDLCDKSALFIIPTGLAISG
jgi:hypothetical protein